MGSSAKFTREVTSRGLSSTTVLITGYRHELVGLSGIVVALIGAFYLWAY